LFNAKWTIYQLYHGENKLQFWWNDDGVHIVLDQQAELDINNNEFIFKNNFNKTSLLINNYFVSSSFLLYLVHILIQIWFFVFSWDIFKFHICTRTGRFISPPPFTYVIYCLQTQPRISKGKKVNESDFNQIGMSEWLLFNAKWATIYILLYNIYIAHYITITLSASHYKTIKIIQDTNWYEVKVKSYATYALLRDKTQNLKHFSKSFRSYQELLNLKPEKYEYKYCY
jgi:hypothetical protein